jgi:hypothetical protein
MAAMTTLLAALILQATTQTHDLATFEPPPGKKGEIGSSLTWTDATATTFCQYVVSKSIPSLGDAAKDFDADWASMIAKPYTLKGERKSGSLPWPGGWTLTMGAAPATTEASKDFVALLAVFTGHGVRVAVQVNFNDEAYQPKVDAFINSFKLAKPAPPPPKRPAVDDPNAPPPLKGWPWRKVISQYSNWGYNPSLAELGKISNQGYSRWTYTFGEDGTYDFKSEFFSMSKHQEYWWHEETGTYTLEGETLKIAPKQSKRILRNKQGEVVGAPVDVPLEAASCRFHYFEGIREWTLVLTPAGGEQTKRDGTFGINALFPNSYFYSKPPEPR